MYFDKAMKELSKHFDIRLILQQIERGMIVQKILLNKSQLEVMDVFNKQVLNRD